MEHFEFDPIKSERNKKRHRVDLEWAQGLWDVTHIHPGQGCHWREPLPDPGEDRQQVLRRRLHKERRGDQIDQLPQGGSPIGANL